MEGVQQLAHDVVVRLQPHVVAIGAPVEQPNASDSPFLRFAGASKAHREVVQKKWGKDLYHLLTGVSIS